MNRLTPLILLAVVAVLGYLAYQQTGHEADHPLEATGPLFPGVEVRRLASVRIENIRGSRHFRMERDASGRWYLTDPMAWPAEPGLMDKLEQVFRSNLARQIPDALIPDAEASFDPPRGFIEAEERLEGGDVRRVRVEIGATDLDGARVFVRRDGRIYRTHRNIETLLTFNLKDYRAKNIFTMTPGEVVTVERVGGWYQDGAQESLGMLAYRDGYGWRIEKPVTTQGDPVIFQLWTRFLTSMRALRFASDRVDEDLSRFELDAPWVTLSLTNGAGATQAVHFASAEGRIYARRDGQPTIYEIDTDDGFKVREPVTHFFDDSFVRFERARLKHVFLGRGVGSLRISPKGDAWTIAARSRAGADYDMDLPADARVVESLLTVIEGAGIPRYFMDVAPTDFFPEGEHDRGIWVETTEGIVQGGAFAESVRTPEGTELVPLLRDGDSVVAGVDPALAELVDTTLDDYLDRQLWSLSNARLRGLTFEKDGVERSFKRSDTYDWRPTDADVPARELDKVLDHLLFLKASEHLAEGERPELSDVVTVTFVDGRGTESVVRVGVTPEGQAQADVGVLRAILRHQALHGDLVEIMSRRPDRPSRSDR